MEFTFAFLEIFLATISLIAPILLSLSVIIISAGQIVARIEKWDRLDALYWTLITATTVGYGDIRPTRHISRMISIVIAILGVIFTGIIVSIAIEATSNSFRIYGDIDTAKEYKEKAEDAREEYQKQLEQNDHIQKQIKDQADAELQSHWLVLLFSPTV